MCVTVYMGMKCSWSLHGVGRERET